MNTKIKEQILAIRETGLTNMFDINTVQRIAFDMNLHEFVDWIDTHKNEYTRFILYGDESNQLN